MGDLWTFAMTAESIPYKEDTHVGLVIKSKELTLERISDIVGLKPDKSKVIGDWVGGPGGIRHETNVWTLESSADLDLDTDSHLDSLFNRLEGTEEAIQLLSQTENVIVFFAIYRYDYFNISFNLSALNIKRLADLGVSIFVDTYGLAGHSDED